MFLPPMVISRSPSTSGAIRPPRPAPASKSSALCPCSPSASAAAIPAMPPPTIAKRRPRSLPTRSPHVRDADGSLAAHLAALRARHLAAAAVLVEHHRADHVRLELGELRERYVVPRHDHARMIPSQRRARAGHRPLLNALEQQEPRYVVERVVEERRVRSLDHERRLVAPRLARPPPRLEHAGGRVDLAGARLHVRPRGRLRKALAGGLLPLAAAEAVVEVVRDPGAHHLAHPRRLAAYLDPRAHHAARP